MSARRALGAIGVAWGAGAIGGALGAGGLAVTVAFGVVAVVATRGSKGVAGVAVVGVVCAASGWIAVIDHRAVLDAPVPEGAHRVTVRVVSDPVPDRDSMRAVVVPLALDGVEWAGPALLARGDLGEIRAGQLVELSGRTTKRPFTVRGDAIAGTIQARSVTVVSGSSMLSRAANAVRDRVADTIEPWRSSSAALVAGFLIGDTRMVSDADLDAMRRSGLSHYVAVSGSNVALFLAAWWLLSGPLALSVRRRSVIGLVGLVLFVAITRAEPSVVRAS
ncbi:MAG: hypothetical protein HKO87_03840, partial [Acidimicrobiia bacterium]|nr:hypothetical protein [Acidimicrobiia bacterium]